MKKGSFFLIVIAIVLLASLIFLFEMDRASRLRVWHKTYGGTKNEQAWSLIQTGDQGYAIIGLTGSDAWLVKTDSTGNMEWNKTYGGTNSDFACSVVQISDGGYVIAGYTTSFGARGLDLWLVRMSSSGKMQWSETYGGKNDEGALFVIQTMDNGYAMVGATNSFGIGGSDFWLVKTDSAGNVQWNKTYGGKNHDSALSVVQTSYGGYALAGVTYSYGVGGSDAWLVKTDSTGNMEWNKTYGGTRDDYLSSVVRTSDGAYAFAGYTYSYGVGGSDFWLVKTDSAGNVQWNKTYGGVGFQEAYSLVQTKDGGYALAGSSRINSSATFLLVKTDANGNHLLNQTYDGVPFYYTRSMVHTTDGGYAMAGYVYSNETRSSDFLLLRTDAYLALEPAFFWTQWWFWSLYGGVSSVSIASYLLTTKRESVSNWLTEIKLAKQKSEMEKTMLDYIQTHQGKINLRKSAQDLNLTEEQVKETLSRLEEKRLIKTKK